MDTIFTHYWVTGFGWETTIFQPSDFEEVEKLGYSEGVIFLAKSDKGINHILKGYYE